MECDDSELIIQMGDEERWPEAGEDPEYQVFIIQDTWISALCLLNEEI